MPLRIGRRNYQSLGYDGGRLTRYDRESLLGVGCQSYGDDVSGFGARFSFLDSALANLTKTTISSTSLLKVSRPSISTNSRPLQRTQRRFSDLMGASSERPSFLSSPL